MSLSHLIKLIREALHNDVLNRADTVNKYSAGAAIHCIGVNGKKFRILIEEED